MGFPRHRPPITWWRLGSSSPELGLLFRVRSCLSPARCSKVPGASSRVPFPFATQACGVHSTPGFPHPTTFRPQRFSRSRRVAPPHTSWACFIPLPRPGFALQGLSPLSSQLASSTSCALMLLSSFSSRRVAPPVPDPLAHLQGVNPDSDPLQPIGGLGPSTARSPPALSTPSGLSPDA